MPFDEVQVKSLVWSILVAYSKLVFILWSMKELISLNCRLINYGGRESAQFCGKLVSIMLYSGLFSDEAKNLTQTIISCSIMDRVAGANFRLIHELCPRLMDFIPTNYWQTKDIPFALFFNQILKSTGV